MAELSPELQGKLEELDKELEVSALVVETTSLAFPFGVNVQSS